MVVMQLADRARIRAGILHPTADKAGRLIDAAGLLREAADLIERRAASLLAHLHGSGCTCEPCFETRLRCLNGGTNQ
jgi:hypothetical protein